MRFFSFPNNFNSALPILTAKVLLTGVSVAIWLLVSPAAANEPTNRHPAEIPLESSVAVNGHSITDGTKGLERAIRIGMGIIPSKYHEMTGPYASLEYRWDRRVELSAGGKTTPEALAEGNYAAFITTEANDWSGPYPGGGIIPESRSGPYAVKLFDLYYATNSDGQGYILTFWNNRLDHPDVNIPGWEFDTPEQWRERIKEDQEVWEKIRDYVNENKESPGADVMLIPYLDLYRVIYDNLSSAPTGANTLFDWFIDNVHPSDRGRWAGGALIAYQMFGIDPATAPLNLNTQSHDFGTGSASVSPAERDFLAPLIRQVVDQGA